MLSGKTTHRPVPEFRGNWRHADFPIEILSDNDRWLFVESEEPIGMVESY